MQFKEENMSKFKEYKCPRCGYIYREGRGDSRKDIHAGTKFEDLPDSFRCPTCNEPKMAFELRRD
jgi:rubredoxin